MVRTLSALSSLRPFTAAARRAASLLGRAGGKMQASDPLFEALEERTLLAADVTVTLTVPALTGLASAGGALSGSILLANTGNAAATGFTYRVFLSSDTVIGNEDDVELTDEAGLQATLAAGATSFVNLNTFSVPTDVRPGAYFLITTLDTAGVVAEGEAGEANNTVHSTSPVIVLNGPAGSPNVSATITFPARTINPDQHITVPTTIRNTGTGAATNFHVTWVLSVNNIIGDSDDIAIDEEEIASLAAGATLSLSRDIQLPVGIDLGSYRVGVWVDDRADVAETNEGDNRAITSSAALTVGLPDLTATFTTSGGTLQPGGFFTGTLTVRNNTQALATPFSVFISLSSNNIAGDEDDILLMRVDITDALLEDTGLAGGGVRTITGLRVYIPYGTPADGGPLNPGAYRVVVQVDEGNEVAESNENNNSTVGSSANVTIGARNTANDPEGSDLFGFAFPISGSFQPGQTVNVPAIFANLGNALATGVSMSAYISSDSTFDGGDILLSENVLADEDMDVGSLYALVPLVIPGAAPNGNFFIIFRADPENTVEETDEANNTAATTGTATVTRSTVSITAPDSAAAETAGTANNGQFRISRTGSTASDLVVNYTIGGTADGDDYNDEAFTGSVTIPAGQSFVLISVPVLNDAAAENDETLVLTISADGNYTVSGTQGSATVTIADNDPRVGITAVDAAAAESSGTANGGQFRFTRTNGTTGAMVVHFTVTGTAAAGDFTLSVPAGGTLVYDDETGEGTVTIADGQASALLNVSVTQDAVGEDAETVIVTIAEDEAYSISPTANDATVTVADDEPLVTVTTNDASAAETTATANGGRFTFTRPGPATGLGALVIHFTMTGSATD
ncbi:MAG TPA: CARDB domain-containing protein, partial [Phycisphaerales bacterium]|nr:CARDB domain-containing protein [Phycisphaerales bacterium]